MSNEKEPGSAEPMSELRKLWDSALAVDFPNGRPAPPPHVESAEPLTREERLAQLRKWNPTAAASELDSIIKFEYPGRATSLTDEPLLPNEYLLAKLAMVIPLFEEARDALTAIREDQRVRHGISKTLADRMDIAGTYTVEDWRAASPDPGAEP